MKVLVIVTCILCVVVVHSQTAPYVTFEGTVLSNHSFVNITRVGNSGDGSDTVQCHTDLDTCCSGGQGVDRGDWFFPNGNRLPLSGGGDIYEARVAQRVDLQRTNANPITNGIYQCTIETNAVNEDGREIVYVGLYASGGEIHNVTCIVCEQMREVDVAISSWYNIMYKSITIPL